VPGLESPLWYAKGVTTTYCHPCAVSRPLLDPLPVDPVTSAYQLDKYAKHTRIASSHALQSVFATPSTQVYTDYVVNTLAAGAVVVDRQGRVNVIWCAGRGVGYRVERRQNVAPTDPVQVVLASDSAKVHAYTVHSSPVIGARCAGCGGVALSV
jgi:hypothetical protein